MKNKNLRKAALWLFIISIISFVVFPIVESSLKNFTVLQNIGNILFIILFLGGFFGAIVAFITSFFVKENNSGIKLGLDNAEDDSFSILMTSQLPAMYIKTSDEAYKEKYFERLLQAGLPQDDVLKLFDFECKIIKKHNKQYLWNQQFTQMWFFGLRQVFFQQYPKKKEDILNECFFTISEICKIIDEAEWHYWNSHEKVLPEGVWNEICEWRLKGKGMEFASEYFNMIVEKTGVSVENIYKLAEVQGLHLSKYKWC